MRAHSYVVLLTLAAASAASAASDKACLTCHTAPLFDADTFRKSVHAKLDCVDCHKGYDFALHRAKEQQPVPALVQKLAGRSTAPEAVAACGSCHESALQDVTASVHGRWLRENRPVAGPLCLDCHGSPHAIPTSKALAGVERKKVLAARCEQCHEDAQLVKKAGLSEHAVPGFVDSAHGRLLKLGNERVPACYGCHGYHEISGVHLPTSAVIGLSKIETCAECHKGANQSFADSFSHQPLKTRPIPYYTIVGFSWLTVLTVIALVFHMGLDFFAQLRMRLRRRRGIAMEPALPHGAVKRFDIHELAQHWIILAAVITLVITDWPLRAPQIVSSEAIVDALGGIHVAQLIHRIAGVALGVAAAYHLIYLTVYLLRRYNWKEGGLFGLPMMFSPRDVVEVFQNLAWFFGLRKEKPKFAKYTYAEKFDYWAVFWGVAIMFGTGLVRWFPVWFAQFMPASVLEAMQVAHGDEATLCVMALFVWHLYNVHISPRVFPMSWSWLDGRIGYAALYEEHRGQFDELFPRGLPPPAPGKAPAPAGGAPPKPAPAKKEDAP